MSFVSPESYPVVREITACDLETEAGQALRQHMIGGEMVHPVKGGVFQEYLKRLARDLDLDGGLYEKHCYGLYRPGASLPSAAVYVKLLRLPTQERFNLNGFKERFVDDTALPGDITHTLYGDNGCFLDLDPNTAIFYSISAFPSPKIGRAELKDTRPGAALIKGFKGALAEDIASEVKSEDGTVPGEGVAQILLRELGITKFSTLSPLRQKILKPDGSVEQRGFRITLRKQILAAQDPATLFTHEEAATIQRLYPKVSAGENFDIGIQFLTLAEHQSMLEPTDRLAVHKILRALALDYLISPVRANKREEIDGVEDFHLGNGAKIGNIHVKSFAETTENEWDYAFGVMVNYVYELDNATERASRFKAQRPEVPANPAIMAEYRTRQHQLILDHPEVVRSAWARTVTATERDSALHR